MKVDKTKPVKAPEGFHWVIGVCDGIIGNPVGIELMADDPEDKKWPIPAASALARKPSQIRKVSKRVLKEWWYERADRAYKLQFTIAGTPQ